MTSKRPGRLAAWLATHRVIVLVAAVGAAAPGFPARTAAAADDPAAGTSDVLARLTEYDSIYRTGLTTTADERRNDRIDIAGPFFKVESRWRLTFEEARVGYLKEVTRYDTPSYLAPSQRRWAADVEAEASRAAKDEPMTVTVRMKEWGYWGSDACGNFHEEVAVQVHPDGRAERVGKLANVSLYPPDDLSPIATLRVFQWGLGRFFSERIARVTRVEPGKTGLLHVVAIGDRYPGDRGTWDLEVEPEAAWMVREARFTRDARPDRIAAAMKNEGTVWKGSFCVPERAQANFWGPLEDPDVVGKTMTVNLRFGPVTESFDDRFYDECRRSVMSNSEPNLTVTDARVSPPSITRPNRQVAGPALPEPPRRGRGWVFAANLLAVIVLLTAVAVRKGRKSALTPTPF